MGENVHFIIHSPRQDGICRQGVALILKKYLEDNIVNYKAISKILRIIPSENLWLYPMDIIQYVTKGDYGV